MARRSIRRSIRTRKKTRRVSRKKVKRVSRKGRLYKRRSRRVHPHTGGAAATEVEEALALLVRKSKINTKKPTNDKELREMLKDGMPNISDDAINILMSEILKSGV